jgi:hypothetical protein
MLEIVNQLDGFDGRGNVKVGASTFLFVSLAGGTFLFVLLAGKQGPGECAVMNWSCWLGMASG